MTEEQVFDNPTGWVARHIRTYVESDGKKGHDYQGLPTLLLTTRGHKSGLLRRTALIYGRDGERYLLVPSNGGADEHPGWYRNLSANPEVVVQVRGEKFTARARTASAEEKPALWELMVGVFPQYAKYQEKSARDIPVVVLERV